MLRTFAATILSILQNFERERERERERKTNNNDSFREIQSKEKL